MNNTKKLHLLAAIAWFLLILYLLTIPGTSLPEITWIDKYQGDKLIHITLFGVLGYLFSYPVKDHSKKFFWISVIAITGFLYGVAMEFVQKYFIPFRSFDIDDMLADGAGSLLAYWWWRKQFKKQG
ncbi:MAG: VanZ family protein [Bacteroidota bacterium]|nr:VanZ family protein [Bacteroidota bacterium]